MTGRISDRTSISKALLSQDCASFTFTYIVDTASNPYNPASLGRSVVAILNFDFSRGIPKLFGDLPHLPELSALKGSAKAQYGLFLQLSTERIAAPLALEIIIE